MEFKEFDLYTLRKCNKKLKYLITCYKCEVSGRICDENCSFQYVVGNKGEIIENLEKLSALIDLM